MRELQKGCENPRDEKQSCGRRKFNLPALNRDPSHYRGKY